MKKFTAAAVMFIALSVGMDTWDGGQPVGSNHVENTRIEATV